MYLIVKMYLAVFIRDKIYCSKFKKERKLFNKVKEKMMILHMI
ncbi:hypothetical protein BCE_3481 [Bacillus cereus ATCC 10987]|uniref:Uncharacterized protein n=1 Tax=Bacillus cereus (strain ATCC 10987 / NRS 248) TaxID=222523 RepID=Q734C6_BACC1|nr:hypothetical protein BCE_3481 [Bacillus cereus ATCC 10987]